MPYQREKINTKKKKKWKMLWEPSYASATAALIYLMIQFIFRIPFHLFSRVISVIVSTIIQSDLFNSILHNAFAVFAANKCVRMAPVTYWCSQLTYSSSAGNEVTQTQHDKFNENGNSTFIWVIVGAAFRLFSRPFCAHCSFFGRLALHLKKNLFSLTNVDTM